MSVRVEKVGNRILLASSTPTPGLKNSIPGAYFRQDKTWSLPLDLETCALLRERFGGRLEISPMLWDWAKIEKAQRKQQAATASAADAELKLLPEVAPILSAAMSSRTYQRAAVRFVADTRGRDGRRRALIGDTVGLGKTAEALGAVLESGTPGPFLVVCPKTAVNTAWTPEIRRWLPEDTIVTVPDGKAKRDAILDSLLAQNRAQAARGFELRLELTRTWVVIHPAAIRTQTWWICALCASKTRFKAGIVTELDCGHDKDRCTKVQHEHAFPQLFSMEWGAVIMDESDQSLIRLTGTPNLTRRGAEMLRDLVRPEGVRLAMSGTPFRSKAHQLWSTLNWLDPVRWSSKWNWVKKYWTLGGYAGYSIGDFIEIREGMLTGELSDVLIRRTREQVRGDLPPKLYAGSHLDPTDPSSPKGVWLPMTPKQEKAYRAMERSASAEVNGGTVTAVGVLAELTRLKQFAGALGAVNVHGEFVPQADGNKFEWLVEFLTELGFPDKPSGKIVVASQFTQLLNAFSDGLAKQFKGLTSGRITGEVTQLQREAFIAAFEDPNSDLSILFINTKAGGSAITLDQADVMVILDETWVDDEREQLEGRIDNRNPEKRIVPRTYYYLRSLGTVEESIAAANAEAKRQGKRVLDGKLAVDFAKGMLPS